MTGIPVHFIAAVAENGVIGRDGDMPWRLSTDLKRFKALTTGKPIIMGRKTWASLGRPLPGRLNIVITRDQNFSAEGALVVHSLQEALLKGRQNAEDKKTDAVFVIGGGEIYREALPFADKMFITKILGAIDGDTYFPSFDKSEWHLASTQDIPAGDKDSHATQFITYERIDLKKK